MQYEVRPLPEHEQYSEIGGAYANCFVLADSPNGAERIALQAFHDAKWKVVSVEEPPSPTKRSNYPEEEWLALFDQASLDGECYAFHQWPPEAQEDDPIH